ncbi:hypothetical protein, partial [Streptomyces scabiei]|uniref:hypothetical protein n=1 Tax=Streptomyces scabiei TaxID=1930 RepID=UPI0038F803DC
MLGIEDQEVATEYINAHRHAYCTARGDLFTISDLSRINRLSNMSTKESGKIVIISGPSCAGKD